MRDNYSKFYQQTIVLVMLLAFLSSCEESKPKVLHQKNNLETIEILVSENALNKIVIKRNEALKLGVLMTSKKDLVEGLIVFGDDTLPAKIRLKGDQTDHLITKKWSLRVILNNYSEKLKMKTFSLQHPACSGYLYDWTFYQLIKPEGLIGLKLDFVNVNFNGVSNGIYALEQHFDQSVLLQNNRLSGPILKIDEDKYWEQRKGGIAEKDKWKQLSNELYRKSKVKAFYKNEIAKELSKEGRDLLNNYRKEKIEIEKAFDIELLAKFYALCEIYGTEHALVWRNRRFYYNPKIKLLEPVAYDANKIRPHKDSSLYLYKSEELIPEVTEQLMLNNKFNKAYYSYLVQYSKPEFLDEFFVKMTPKMDSILTILRKEYPNYVFPKTAIYQEQKNVRKILQQNKILPSLEEK